MKYKLTCTDWNTAHVKFNLFDPTGANCGQLVIHAPDLVNFLQNSWKGNISWDGKMPEWLYGKESEWPGYYAHAHRPVQYPGHGPHDEPKSDDDPIGDIFHQPKDSIWHFKNE